MEEIKIGSRWVRYKAVSVEEADSKLLLSKGCKVMVLINHQALCVC